MHLSRKDRSSSLVAGACKPKRKAPKLKYLEPLTNELSTNAASIHPICRALQLSLHSPDPTVTCKALITIHHVISHGETDNSVMRALSGSSYLNMRTIQQRSKLDSRLVRYAAYLVCHYSLHRLSSVTA